MNIFKQRAAMFLANVRVHGHFQLFFIALPEIVRSLGGGWVMNHLPHNNRLAAVVAGDVFMAARGDHDAEGAGSRNGICIAAGRESEVMT
jgi:hypothetical protein